MRRKALKCAGYTPSHSTYRTTEGVTPWVTWGVTHWVTEGVTESVTDRVTESATQGFAQGVADRVTEWVTDSVTQGATESVAERVTEWVTESVTEGSTQGVTEGVTESVLHPVLAGVPWYRTAGLRSVGVLDCECAVVAASGFAARPRSGRALCRGSWPAILQQGFLLSRFGIAPHAQPSPPHWQPAAIQRARGVNNLAKRPRNYAKLRTVP
jgi:hypothetical protein